MAGRDSAAQVELARRCQGADERHLVANFTSNGHWHKNCAGNYKRQHHADKSKNNAVVVVLEIGFVFRAAGPMT